MSVNVIKDRLSICILIETLQYQFSARFTNTPHSASDVEIARIILELEDIYPRTCFKLRGSVNLGAFSLGVPFAHACGRQTRASYTHNRHTHGSYMLMSSICICIYSKLYVLAVCRVLYANIVVCLRMRIVRASILPTYIYKVCVYLICAQTQHNIHTRRATHNVCASVKGARMHAPRATTAN